MKIFRSTTILGVRHKGKSALGGDGQVTFGDSILKLKAKKIRRLHDNSVLAGFAGASADAFTLFEKFEKRLDQYSGNLSRSAVELAKEWRTDKYLRVLEAQLVVIDKESLHLSDIQFSQKIELCNGDRSFVKNKRYVEPYAVPILANGSADIHLYFEIYNLTYQPEKLNYNYTAYFTIFNKETEKIKKFQRVHKIPGTNAAHSVRLNVNQFLGGEYDLTIQILDEATGQIVEATKSFTVLNRSIASLDLFQRN